MTGGMRRDFNGVFFYAFFVAEERYG